MSLLGTINASSNVGLVIMLWSAILNECEQSLSKYIVRGKVIKARLSHEEYSGKGKVINAQGYRAMSIQAMLAKQGYR